MQEDRRFLVICGSFSPSEPPSEEGDGLETFGAIITAHGDPSTYLHSPDVLYSAPDLSPLLALSTNEHPFEDSNERRLGQVRMTIDGFAKPCQKRHGPDLGFQKNFVSLGLRDDRQASLLSSSLRFESFKIGRTVINVNHDLCDGLVARNVPDGVMHVLGGPAVGRVALGA